jgi:hypothetical protein
MKEDVNGFGKAIYAKVSPTYLRKACGRWPSPGSPFQSEATSLQYKKRHRSGCAYRIAPEGDLYLRAVAPCLLGEDAQRLPFSRTGFCRLPPELLGDALNGEHVLQRDNIVRHCAAPHIDARKIANRP